MKRPTIKYLTLIITVMMSMTACKKFVEISPPKDQLVTSTVFADSLGATAAIKGIYVNMMQYSSLSFSNGAITLYAGLSADELITTKNNSEEAEFYNNAINVGNGIDQQLWPIAYKIIYSTNACIEGISAASNIGSATKNSLIGEALVIRSFIYFNLMELYGAVPYVTSTDYNVSRLMSRTAPDEIYVQLINDLKIARKGLLAVSNANTRANYYAATALLAKVYLYHGLNYEAIAEANKIIGSGVFSLEEDLNSVFLTGSKETIWSLAPVQPNKQTNEGFSFAPTRTTVIPGYVIASGLYDSFETGDLRTSKWIGINTVAGRSYPYPYKYKKGRSSEPITENYTVYRLSEQYLISAEAKANIANLQGALEDLNVVRNRAGLPNFFGSDKLSIRSAIFAERRHELFCEWGNRWFDLNRSNMSNTILGGIKTGWSATSNLYPIPQTEVTANPRLTQNPGY